MGPPSCDRGLPPRSAGQLAASERWSAMADTSATTPGPSVPRPVVGARAPRRRGRREPAAACQNREVGTGIAHPLDGGCHCLAGAPEAGADRHRHQPIGRRHRLGEGIGRRVGPQLHHREAGAAEEIADHGDRQGVKVAGYRPDHHRSPAAPRAPEERAQPSGQASSDRAGAVLLAYRNLAPTPAVADLAQGRRQESQVEVGRRGPGRQSGLADREGAGLVPLEQTLLEGDRGARPRHPARFGPSPPAGGERHDGVSVEVPCPTG